MLFWLHHYSLWGFSGTGKITCDGLKALTITFLNHQSFGDCLGVPGQSLPQTPARKERTWRFLWESRDTAHAWLLKLNGRSRVKEHLTMEEIHCTIDSQSWNNDMLLYITSFRVNTQPPRSQSSYADLFLYWFKFLFIWGILYTEL